jgi:phage gpG-like protein
MSNRKPHEVPDFLEMGKKLKEQARMYAKTTAVQWFQDSFINQGFTGSAFEPWDKRKNDLDPGRAILIKTTYLQKSIEVMSESGTSVVFGTSVPYAKLHNEGGRLRVNQYIRAHHRTRNGKRTQVQAHSRKLDIKFPKRQFMGHSEKLMDSLDQWLFNQILTQFKQL